MKNKKDNISRSELIAEYKLILQKKSKLSRKQRDIVEAIIARMHKAGRVTIEELKINNNQI
jgi:hypothetical protein